MPEIPSKVLPDNPEECVYITEKEYNRLLVDSEKLSALEAAGVDNWEGYGQAMVILDAATVEAVPNLGVPT